MLVLDYSLSWAQAVRGSSGRTQLHPYHAFSRGIDPPLIHVSEYKRPRLDRDQILQVSSDPHGGFIRGFLNEGLWAYDGSWVPFRWFHHLTPAEHRKHSGEYPPVLPGQLPPYDEPPSGDLPGPMKPQPSTPMDPDRLTAIIEGLSQLHRNEQRKTES